MAQGRGKRIRKVKKVPPPQHPATTIVSENLPATTIVHAYVRERANMPPRADVSLQANVPPPANMAPTMHQPPTQHGMPFMGIGMKRKRGKSGGKALQDLIKANGGPLRVDFHPTIHVPSDDIISKMFTSEIGITVRGGAPVCQYGWSDVDEDDKRDLREDLRVFFVVDLSDPVVVAYVDSKMSTAYSQFKSRLKKEWQGFGSPELGRANLPNADLWNERPVLHWHWLCDNIYTNRSCIEIAEKNSANRYMQQHTHRVGARPYVQHVLAASKEGKELSLINNWGEKHKDDNHEWINEVAKKKYEKMEAERIALIEKLYREAPEGTPHDSIKLTLEASFQ
ncbi:putative transposase, Ptta/En/Spm, plant [Rosa chinensis]|uniref:Putative transposase, Ptta/En/Spm, plant n=2 Tax=Rosa chinensis TaxID=74649 RepID=A0A2P6Q9J9_ROSCH|nr:putative transposase, Ptta/En/Spm, plant [Rosa chinensis]